MPAQKQPSFLIGVERVLEILRYPGNDAMTTGEIIEYGASTSTVGKPLFAKRYPIV